MRFPTNGIPTSFFGKPKGHIIQGFGENPALYAQWHLAGHDGIDIVPELAYGEPVYAPHAGLVVMAWYNANPALGNQVHILSAPFPDGRQLLSKLGHFDPNQLVFTGAQVYDGQQIAEMGDTGNVVSGGIDYWHQENPDHRGTHTHWSTYWLRQQDSPSNVSYFGKNYIVENYNNGFFGAFDPMSLKDKFMTNAKLVKNGPEYGFYLPATSEAEMIGKALNLGYPIPTLNNGQNVDWTNLKPDLTIGT